MFARFYNCTDHSDVRIVVGETQGGGGEEGAVTTFYCHAIVLRATSPYFDRCLDPSKPWKEVHEHVIRFGDVSADTMKLLLQSMYGKFVQYDPVATDLIELLRTAHLLEIQNVQNEVVDYFYKNSKCLPSSDDDVVFLLELPLSNGMEYKLWEIAYKWMVKRRKGTAEQKRHLLSHFKSIESVLEEQCSNAREREQLWPLRHHDDHRWLRHRKRAISQRPERRPFQYTYVDKCDQESKSLAESLLRTFSGASFYDDGLSMDITLYFCKTNEQKEFCITCPFSDLQRPPRSFSTDQILTCPFTRDNIKGDGNFERLLSKIVGEDQYTIRFTRYSDFISISFCNCRDVYFRGYDIFEKYTEE